MRCTSSDLIIGNAQGLTPVRCHDPLAAVDGCLSAIIGMVSAIDRKHCPLSIGTAVRLHRNPQSGYSMDLNYGPEVIDDTREEPDSFSPFLSSTDIGVAQHY